MQRRKPNRAPTAGGGSTELVLGRRVEAGGTGLRWRAAAEANEAEKEGIFLVKFT